MLPWVPRASCVQPSDRLSVASLASSKPASPLSRPFPVHKHRHLQGHDHDEHDDSGKRRDEKEKGLSYQQQKPQHHVSASCGVGRS